MVYLLRIPVTLLNPFSLVFPVIIPEWRRLEINYPLAGLQNGQLTCKVIRIALNQSQGCYTPAILVHRSAPRLD